jgi:hypothetical protein
MKTKLENPFRALSHHEDPGPSGLAPKAMELSSCIEGGTDHLKDEDTIKLCREARESLNRLMDDIMVKVKCKALDPETGMELSTVVKKATRLLNGCIRDLNRRKPSN